MEIESSVLIDGRKYHAQIGKVKRVHLGREDHGIVSVNVDFEGDGWGQGSGHYGLKDSDIVYNIVDVFDTIDIVGETVFVLREKPYGQIQGFLPAEKSEKVAWFRPQGAK